MKKDQCLSGKDKGMLDGLFHDCFTDVHGTLVDMSISILTRANEEGWSWDKQRAAHEYLCKMIQKQTEHSLSGWETTRQIYSKIT